MDINQIRPNLKHLEDSGLVTQAGLHMGMAGNLLQSCVRLIVSPPYSTEREAELTRMAREAVGSRTIRVLIEYGARESANGRD